jgi:hypothetical protein
VVLQCHHFIHEIFQLIRQPLLGLGKHRVFFFCHMLPDDAHEVVKFHLKRCFVTLKALQLAHEFSDMRMGEAAVSYELCPILASHGCIRRVEDLLFQLRVQLQLGKDLFCKQMLSAKIPGALISGKEIFDLLMIGFEQSNGIDRVLRFIVPGCQGPTRHGGWYCDRERGAQRTASPEQPDLPVFPSAGTPCASRHCKPDNPYRKECYMESQQRLHMITTLNEEADQKRLALTHALGAQERIQQGPVSTHGAPLTEEEQALKYERDLWERLQLSLNEAEKILRELEQLEQDRGVGSPR